MRKPPGQNKTRQSDSGGAPPKIESAGNITAPTPDGEVREKQARGRTAKAEKSAESNASPQSGAGEAIDETAFPPAAALDDSSETQLSADAANDAPGTIVAPGFDDPATNPLEPVQDEIDIEAFPSVGAPLEVLAPPVDTPSDTPPHPQHLLKRTGGSRLSKRAAGAVRPHGTRPVMSRRMGKLDCGRSRTVAAALVSGAAPNFAEFEEILNRMVERIAKFLQADKCVFMLHDPRRDELQAVSPARGFTADELASFTTSTRGIGLAAWVFRRGAGDSGGSLPGVILAPGEVESDERAVADGLAHRFGVIRYLTVPFIIENRNDDNDIVSKETVGVAHVFNKIIDGGFTDNDKTLLVTMSRTAASIFSSAKAFREVVYEKQELIQTLDSIYVGLVMIGLDGRIMQINPAARSVLELGEESSVVGRHYADTVRNDSFKRLLDKSLEGAAPIEMTGEITVQMDTEERIYQAHCAPVKNQDRDATIGLLVLMNDVTEIRGVDRMKTAFISTVSHELRTPLTSIKGFIATLRDDTEGFYTKEDQREFYEIINNDCDRLTRLIDDLLNVSRIEQGRAMQLKLEQVDVPAIAAKVLAAQRAYIQPDRHRLSMKFADDFPSIEADADKVDQILTNLVNNAIKYSPHGGPILVSGVANDDGQFVTISVRDHGIGIPREHIKKVFDRFHRVDNRDSREIGGTGIGLYLVKALVDSHKGTVKVDSEAGRGSVFTFTLPIAQPEQPKDDV